MRIFALVFLLSLGAASIPLAVADYTCHGPDAGHECAGDWTEGPGCSASAPAKSYGARGTEVSVEAGSTLIDVTGARNCSIHDGQEYDSTQLSLAAQSGAVGVQVTWLDQHAPDYHRCTLSIAPIAQGDKALACPAGASPPDLMWGELLP